jgi:hypothetical protein
VDYSLPNQPKKYDFDSEWRFFSPTAKISGGASADKHEEKPLIVRRLRIRRALDFSQANGHVSGSARPEETHLEESS